MATPTSKATTETVTELPAFAQQSREQLLSALQQGQKLSLDAAQTWVKVVSKLPVIDLPKIPGLPTMPGVEAATKYSFDLAADLLSSQREYALHLTNTLVPAKTA